MKMSDNLRYEDLVHGKIYKINDKCGRVHLCKCVKYKHATFIPYYAHRKRIITEGVTFVPLLADSFDLSECIITPEKMRASDGESTWWLCVREVI